LLRSGAHGLTTAGSFVLLIQGISSASALFSATKPDSGGLLKKMRPSAIDQAIPLRRWNMIPTFLRVELVTARSSRFSRHSNYEKSFSY
jgi:hypothetical protein